MIFFKNLTTQVRQQYPVVQLQKVSIKNTDCQSKCVIFSKNSHCFANFTIGMIVNETGHLLKCVKIYLILLISIKPSMF